MALTRRAEVRGAEELQSMTEKKKDAEHKESPPPSVDQYVIRDPDRFALNLAHMIEEAGKAASAWAKPREEGVRHDVVAEPVADMVKTFAKLTEYWLSDPGRALEAQTRLFSGYMGVWSNSLRRLGEDDAATTEGVQPDKGDKRFQDPDWGKNAFFDFLK